MFSPSILYLNEYFSGFSFSNIFSLTPFFIEIYSYLIFVSSVEYVTVLSFFCGIYSSSVTGNIFNIYFPLFKTTPVSTDNVFGKYCLMFPLSFIYL